LGIIAEKLKSFCASLANYKRIGSAWLAQFVSGVDPVYITLHRDRKGKCGAPSKLTAEIGSAIVELQGKYEGGLSRRCLAGKLAAEKGIAVSHGIWPFTLERLAQQSNKFTGTKAGDNYSRGY